MVKKTILALLVFCTCLLNAQTGGTKAFRFLELPMTARAAALGGNTMAFWGDDINLLYANPAALNPGMQKQLPFNYCNFVGDMNLFSTAYAHSLKDKGMVAGGIQSFGYGKFKGYDEAGNETGSFKANDYSINLNYAKAVGADSSFNVGLCLKTILSQYETYTAVGNAFDFGIIYHTKKNFTMSLQARNFGFVWKNYSAQKIQSSDLPRTVQLGLSYKPANAPFRLFVVYDQLTRWNLDYVSPIDTAGRSSSLTFGDTKKDSTDWQKFRAKAGNGTDNFMRHVVLGTELSLGKNFFLRIAYNYRRQKEMTLPDRRGAAGLSFGFGLKVKRFTFSYAFSKMAVPGNASTIGLTLHW